MAGMTPAFCAKQLGHTVEMFLRTYARWIDGNQNDFEMAQLELAEGLFPESYQLLRVIVPEQGSRSAVPVSSLPEGWTGDLTITRGIGDGWLREGRVAVLEVPSVLVPETANWLLNPEHADAVKIRVDWAQRFPYDRRLLS